ncbi:Multicopper oxidase mco [compost metagenome]
MLSDKYKPVIKQTSKGPRWENGDPGIGKFLQLVVQPYSGQDLSMNPAAYEPAKPGKAEGLRMLPLTIDRNSATDQAKLKAARHREFIFGRSDGTDTQPWTIKTDGSFGYSMDPRRINAAPQLAQQSTDGGFSGDGTLEVWKIINGGNGWSHPVHVHFEEGVVLSRDGKAPPEWEKWARKDVYRIGPDIDSSEEVEVAIRFREFAGTYMEHCHNTQHEDSSMLLRWDLEHPGQFQVMPTPLPGWDGVEYVASVGLPTFRTKDHDDDAANKPPVAANDSAATTAGKPITLNVLANDTDPEGNLPLTVVGLSQPDSGQGNTSTNGTTVTYTPPATVPTPFTASFNYSARDAKGAESVAPATVSIAVGSAAVVDQLQVTSATVQVLSSNRFTWEIAGTTSVATGNSITVTAATTGGPVNLGTATMTATGSGASWRLVATTSGYGPATPATVTVKSALGQSVTAPVRYK